VSRLLLDANLSPDLAEALRWRGHDAVHVNDVGLRTAPDRAVFAWAAEKRRAVVTQDRDFFTLARGSVVPPSVIHLRQRDLQRDPVVGRVAQALALGQALQELGPGMERGLVVRVGRTGIHVDARSRGRDRGREPPTAGPLAPRTPGPRPLPSLPGRSRNLGRELPGPGGRGR
jgi:predicted nuclease of predicted toxin-antitoxin system